MQDERAVSELQSTLDRAKGLVGQVVTVRIGSGDWTGAQSAAEWGKDLDSLSARLRPPPNGSAPAEPIEQPKPPSPESRQRFPYYFVEGDYLVKVGRSNNGGTYKHRVPREHFDVVLQKLDGLAKSSSAFDTQLLINQCPTPRHEPLIVLDVLEELALLTNPRRGRWLFRDRVTFRANPQLLWDRIPRV